MDIEQQVYFIVLVGSVVGFTVILATTLVSLPCSYMMNKYIHHGVVIRWLMGLFGTIFNVLVIIYALIMAMLYTPVYYFGLFPSYIPMTVTKDENNDLDPQQGGDASANKTVAPVASWLTRIYELILQFSSPLSLFTDLFTIENFTERESNAYREYKDHVKRIYQGNKRIPQFDVDLMKRVKEAGKETTLDTWSMTMRSLESECANVFVLHNIDNTTPPKLQQ